MVDHLVQDIGMHWDHRSRSLEDRGSLSLREALGECIEALEHRQLVHEPAPKRRYSASVIADVELSRFLKDEAFPRRHSESSSE